MAQQYDTASTTQWHRLLGTLLEHFLTPVGIEVSTNIEVMSSPPEADILLLRRHDPHWTKEQKARLPDGIRDSNASHILIEFKYTESLNEQVIHQSLGYDYFYRESRKLKRHSLQTVAVSAQTPHRKTLKRLGYEPTAHPGVYRSSFVLIEHILLLVSNELADEPHNAPIKCFASRKAVKEKALRQLHTPKWDKTPSAFWWFVDGLFNFWFERQGGKNMPQEQPVTPEFITQLGKQMVSQIIAHIPPESLLEQIPHQELIRHLSPEEFLQVIPHQEILRLFSLEERLSGLNPEERLSGLNPEERLRDLDIEFLEQYLEERKRQKHEQKEIQAEKEQTQDSQQDTSQTGTI